MPVSSKITEFADMFGRNKARLNKTESVELGEPFGVSAVCLVTWQGFGIRWIGQCESKTVLHEVIDGNPILTSTFQNNNIAIVLFEPAHSLTNTVNHCGEGHGKSFINTVFLS